MQRSPHSSFRPKNKDARRCAHFSATSPTRPFVSRNATRSSPSRRTRLGAQSGSGRSTERIAGSQYRRNTSPMGVPGPTRHRSSFSCFVSIFPPPPPLFFGGGPPPPPPGAPPGGVGNKQRLLCFTPRGGRRAPPVVVGHGRGA